jgi:uncharacterized protein with ATP-grasp and redox domains
MKTTPGCAACIIDDLRGALQVIIDDEEQSFAILAEALGWLGSEFRSDAIPSYYITRVHRLLKRRTGLEVPFAELRHRCNEAGLSVAGRLAQRLAQFEDDKVRLQLLCLWAIAGNHLDFRTVGTGYDLSPEVVEALLSQVVEEGLAIDDTGMLAEEIRRKPSVLYLCDNVGEIALDRLLIQELQRAGCAVTAAVKGGPITSDAVLADAQAVGLTDLVRLIVTGPDTLGLPLDEMSPQAMTALQSCSLIIGKGQANYYALSEIVAGAGSWADVQGKVYCLLRTKCRPAATSLGGSDRDRINVAVCLRQ